MRICKSRAILMFRFGSTLVTGVDNFFSVFQFVIHHESSRFQRSGLYNPFPSKLMKEEFLTKKSINSDHTVVS